VKSRRNQEQPFIRQLEFDWQSHPCFVVVPEIGGPVYVIDCADFANPTSKMITIKKSGKKKIGILEMLQIPPNMKDRFEKIEMDGSFVEYRFVHRMFMESKGALNFQIVGIHRLYNQSV
jgi:hypothetical protein